MGGDEAGLPATHQQRKSSKDRAPDIQFATASRLFVSHLQLQHLCEQPTVTTRSLCAAGPKTAQPQDEGKRMTYSRRIVLTNGVHSDREMTNAVSRVTTGCSHHGGQLLETSGTGIIEADDSQVTTVFIVQPSFHHRHSTNRVS